MTEDQRKRLEWCERMLKAAQDGGYYQTVADMTAKIAALRAEIEGKAG